MVLNSLRIADGEGRKRCDEYGKLGEEWRELRGWVVRVCLRGCVVIGCVRRGLSIER